MQTRKILIGCGAAFLLVLMLICTFSVGVRLGERGTMNAQATVNAKTQGQFATPPPVVGGTPDMLGTIQSLGDNTISLTTLQGPRTIGINPQTSIRFENAPAQISDLRPGVVISVWGDLAENRRTLTARVIIILPSTK